MPTYDYQCKRCKAVFEVHATFKQKDAGLTPKCPQCASKATRQLLTPILVMHHGEDGQSVGGLTCGPNCNRGSCKGCGG